MQKIITTVVIIIVIALASFLYLTRPVNAPTQSVESVAERLPTGTPTTEQKLYRISQKQSEVQFSIGEILNGSPFTAVGKTSEVAGDILVSKNTVTVGEIVVNAKTFKTDSTRRDGAIVRFILKSDQPANEFITFKHTKPIVLALPPVVGKEVTATVSGDLTISGVTKPVVMNVKMTLLTVKNQISGDESFVITGDTTVKRSDFGLKIPELSFLASVDDVVKIHVAVTANRIP